MADDELLDVFDGDGVHTGVKRRGDVHRDGDWHLAFHLWIARPDGVLLQRRARDKASWPGFLDATAAGHLLAGETVADGLREVEEELGVRYAFAALEPLGVHRVDESEGRPDGRVNRELQHVFAVRDDRALTGFTGLDAREVAGLVLVGHAAFAGLTSGTPARGEAWDGRSVRAIDVAPEELVPAPYLAALAGPLARVGLSG